MAKKNEIERELMGNITVSVPLDIYLTVKRMSKLERRSMSEVVRGMIETWIDASGVERYTFISVSEKARLREEIRAEERAKLQKELELTLF